MAKLIRYSEKSSFTITVRTTGLSYPAPPNFNYMYNYGFVALVFFFAQIATGIVLAMFYVPNCYMAHNIIVDLTNEVYYG